MLKLRYQTYFALLDVPADIRSVIGKTRLSKTLGTSNPKLAEIRHLKQMAQWKDEFRLARLHLPDYLTKANLIAKTDTDLDPADVKQVLESLGDEAAKQFLTVATKQDVVLQLNIKDYLANLNQVQTSLDQIERDLEVVILKLHKLSDVTSKSIKKWIKDSREEGRTDNAIKRILRAFKKFISYIEYKFDVECRADFTVPNFDKVESVTVDRSMIKDEDAVKLYNSADKRLKCFIEISAFTGMRIGEIGNLRVSNIIVDNLVMCIDINDQVKTDYSIRRVPIHTQLMDTIDRLVAGKKQDDYLFDLPRTGKRHAQVVTNDFSALKTMLGFDRSITFHSFRHSVETKLLRAKVDPKTADQIIGHKTKGSSEGVKTYWHGDELLTLKKTVQLITWPGLCSNNLLHLFE